MQHNVHCDVRNAVAPSAAPACLARTLFALQYEELEKRKAEAEEKVTYIFSRKKAITQGERGRFLCASMACLPSVSAGGLGGGGGFCIVTRKQAII